MLRVIAIDDEPLALRQIVAYISRVPTLQLVAQCLSAIEAQHVLDRDKVDAIFCDINMPDLNGLEFVRTLKDPPMVVFTTAFSEYAIDGFKVEAVDYLLKPYTFKEFSQSVERLTARLELHQRANAVKEVDPSDILYVRADRMDISVPLSTIRAVLGMGEYLRIYTTDRPRPIVTLATMKSMEERLPSDRFIRIHRSSIVALAHIVKVGRGRLVLSDGMELSVGDNYRSELDSWVEQHGIS